jgi:hypothetical protein
MDNIVDAVLATTLADGPVFNRPAFKIYPDQCKQCTHKSCGGNEWMRLVNLEQPEGIMDWIRGCHPVCGERIKFRSNHNFGIRFTSKATDDFTGLQHQLDEIARVSRICRDITKGPLYGEEWFKTWLLSGDPHQTVLKSFPDFVAKFVTASGVDPEDKHLTAAVTDLAGWRFRQRFRL